MQKHVSSNDGPESIAGSTTGLTRCLSGAASAPWQDFCSGWELCSWCEQAHAETDETNSESTARMPMLICRIRVTLNLIFCYRTPIVSASPNILAPVRSILQRVRGCQVKRFLASRQKTRSSGKQNVRR